MPQYTKIETNGVPIYSWRKRELDNVLLEQARVVAENMPIYGRYVLLPNAEAGEDGVPKGAVLALRDGIAPRFIGKDIGSSTILIRLGIKDIHDYQMREIIDEIRMTIELGDTIPRQKSSYGLNTELSTLISNRCGAELLEKAKMQIGSLGGGENMIGFLKENCSGLIYIVIRSGSLCIGEYISDKLNRSVVEYGVIPNGMEHLAYFPSNDSNKPYHCSYALNDISIAARFAEHNRDVLYNKIKVIFSKFYKGNPTLMISLGATSNTNSISHILGKTPSYNNIESFYLHRNNAVRIPDDYSGGTAVFFGGLGDTTYTVFPRSHHESHLTFRSFPSGVVRIKSKEEARRVDISANKLQVRQATVNPSLVDDKYLTIDSPPSAYTPTHEILCEHVANIINTSEEFVPYKAPFIKYDSGKITT